MTYTETLDWMFSKLPMYQQKGKTAFNGKLDNILSFTHYLNYPHKKFKSVHVAGTNGKGSSSHMLASILQEAGYEVGLYTSPHLKDFRERIRINGMPISQKAVVTFIKKHQGFLENHSMSFFEMTVGMAFDYFANQTVDIAIIETGLGGRLDSTNIIQPEVCLITNIGYDHMDILGNTLSKIAYEKAGIIKEGVPVVISEYQDTVAKVFNEIAKEKNAKLMYASTTIKTTYDTPLLGDYQAKNVKGVLAVLQRLKIFLVLEEHIKNGIENVIINTGLMGRWQILKQKPKVVCDTAHNQEGLLQVLEQLQKQNYDHLHIVLGFVKDKNLDMLLPLFPKDATYYFCAPIGQRGLNPNILKEKASTHGLKGLVYDSISLGYEKAMGNAAATDFIYIGGSTFVVAEVV